MWKQLTVLHGKTKVRELRRRPKEFMGVKNMAFKEETPNEGMERQQERSFGLAGHVGGGKGGVGGGGAERGGFSLGTHDRKPH